MGRPMGIDAPLTWQPATPEEWAEIEALGQPLLHELLSTLPPPRPEDGGGLETQRRALEALAEAAFRP